MPTSAGANDYVEASSVPVFDASRPSVARVYDYYLDGKDNYAVGRVEGERMLAVCPGLRELARENRLFLDRAVTWLVGQGVHQFLDIGSGLPTARNTHQIAQDMDRDCRVVYVDYDPVVVAHATALLSDDSVAAVQGDMRDPAGILGHAEVLSRIRPSEPVGLIMAMVLHFVDASTAAAIMEDFIRAIAPGSYVVVSVGSGDEETGGELARRYRATTLYNHSPAQITGFLDGLELTGSGLTDARDWRPGITVDPPPQDGGRILAGVGHKLRARQT